MPEISQRAELMPASPIRKLMPLAEAARARGTKIYQLNIGQPDLPTPQVGLDALKRIDRTILEYSPSDGYRSLREKLAEYYAQYQINLSPDEIIVTAGGSEAVLFAFMSCLNPGDEIIVPEPAYANYMAFAISAGAVIRPVVSTIEQGFALPDIAEFEKLINERTRGILICNPNNPTGYLYTRREMNSIRDLVRKYDLFLFSDEVYREFIYTGSPYISACHLEGIEDHVVLIDSVSKRYSECGIRIGALITKNRQVHDAVMKFCQARLSPPLLGQIVAEASVDAPRSYSAEVYEEYIERRKYLIDGLNRIPGVYSPIPMGAFYTVARLPVDDCDKFCAWCLSDFDYEGETVMLAPASGFYTDPQRGRNEVRIAYILCKEDLQRALVVLGKALEAYNAR
ncbi:MAG: pyridoxal phosphate-dependent aminotransferase [Alistipes senegalensis]|nr:pyridoxal phosphate-dependent aminotransferase [Bacteroides cellulosilyticus]MCM1351202.1 pyridoxal phosphate-dependent aminotransferase [Alistipes senegalensis]